MRRKLCTRLPGKVQPRYAGCHEPCGNLDSGAGRGEDIGDYGVLCRYQQRRQRIAKQPSVSRTALYIFLPTVDAAGCRAQHRADDDGIIYPGRDVLAQRTLGWVAR